MKFPLEYIGTALVVGGAVLFSLGTATIQHERKVQSLGFVLPYTEGTFGVLYEDHCVAKFTSSIKRDEAGTALTIKGDIAPLPGGNTVQFDQELSFNDFSQLFGSIGRIRNLENIKPTEKPGAHLAFNSVGIEPIRIKIKGKLFTQPFEFHTVLAGPVLLVDVGSGYSLQYPSASLPDLPHGHISIVPVSSEDRCQKLEGVQFAPELLQKFTSMLRGPKK